MLVRWMLLQLHRKLAGRESRQDLALAWIILCKKICAHYARCTHKYARGSKTTKSKANFEKRPSDFAYPPCCNGNHPMCCPSVRIESAKRNADSGRPTRHVATGGLNLDAPSKPGDVLTNSNKFRSHSWIERAREGLTRKARAPP